MKANFIFAFAHSVTTSPESNDSLRIIYLEILISCDVIQLWIDQSFLVFLFLFSVTKQRAISFKRTICFQLSEHMRRKMLGE